jgi:D-alanine transaminase/branched-chain amino acid aminotransferase
MSNNFAIVNDTLMPEDKASLQVNDLVIQRGYGVFDFFRTINGKFIYLDEHLDRFFYSASKMRMDPGRSKEKVRELINELVSVNKFPDSAIRIMLTGGFADDGYTVTKPNLIITQRVFGMTTENDETGTTLASYEHQRQLPHIKTVDYIMMIWLRPFMNKKLVTDVLYHQDRIVTECPRSNIFIVTRDLRIVTPADNILKGITRKHVIDIAKKDFMVEEKNVTIEDVLYAKEAFITSTTRQIAPVLELDGTEIGNGILGDITRQLQNELIKSLLS